MLTASRKPVEQPPPRMGALAKLPVFLNLQGKRAVLAGGTEAAAWKAELLAAAGANVDVYACKLEPEMALLLKQGAAAGSLRHCPRAWGEDIFEGAVIALADAETEIEAQAFHDAAVKAGVPVNVIDKPAFCQFQFGSIVNRSPVVVGISSDGVAPILSQAIRRRIEMLLPRDLATWGELAREIRQAVALLLTPGGQRRAFWERFSERVFRGPPGGNERQTLDGLLERIASKGGHDTGRVTMIGAGPGDAELLTVKAVRTLQSADVILFDDLVSEEVLELARREAKRMLVGKRGGRESCRQDDINELMIKLARQGKHVVRLKSGDPMIFGRAGEEIERLDREGIAVAVVPGVSSGIAMASELGISLTHREHAHSVRFVTGHSRAGRLPNDLDWEGLADPETTLVFYMAARTAPEIAERLIEQGLAAETPVVVATAVSRKACKRHHTTLTQLRLETSLSNLGGPVLLGIGTVFGCRQSTAAVDDSTGRDASIR